MGGIETFSAHFQRVSRTLPAVIRRTREAAFARFTDLGFPTTRMEDWKYTNVAPITKIPFQLPNGSPHVSRTDVAGASFPAECQLVFVNGRYSPSLSAPGSLPPGVRVESLAAVLERQPALLEPHLARYADYASQSFTALNTAFIADGAFVSLAKGTTAPAPIHLLFLATAPGAATVAQPRNLILAEEGSTATVVESYVGLGPDTYFTNSVTEIPIGPRARITHYKVQRESAAAFHVASVVAHQEAASHFVSHSVSLGGALVRSDTGTVLDAEGSDCTLEGLYMVTGTQHVDHHTAIDHRQPRCRSRELYKGVLDGRSSGVFNGKVVVRPDAQKSDAAQVNRNLLLADAAAIDTKPQLEIFADDVQCRHGATIGRLDAAAIFYLRSRGIGQANARALLIYAFANELLSRMQVAPVRKQLEGVLSGRFHRHLEVET
ncbi:MAG: Fe-S cluster assembly protein SufD [Candidatus Binatia bacterium]